MTTSYNICNTFCRQKQHCDQKYVDCQYSGVMQDAFHSSFLCRLLIQVLKKVSAISVQSWIRLKKKTDKQIKKKQLQQQNNTKNY